MATTNNITESERNALIRWNEFADSFATNIPEDPISAIKFEISRLVEHGPKNEADEIVRMMLQAVTDIINERGISKCTRLS